MKYFKFNFTVCIEASRRRAGATTAGTVRHRYVHSKGISTLNVLILRFFMFWSKSLVLKKLWPISGFSKKSLITWAIKFLKILLWSIITEIRNCAFGFVLIFKCSMCCSRWPVSTAALTSARRFSYFSASTFYKQFCI